MSPQEYIRERLRETKLQFMPPFCLMLTSTDSQTDVKKTAPPEVLKEKCCILQMYSIV